MGRKKTEFTKEQDARITQLVNDGYSLSGILSVVNKEFDANFSRSGIDRRIKSLGIERTINRTETTLCPRIADKVEELREWKRKQCKSDTITEQNIADAMGISVKTLRKMYKQFDIPQRLLPYSRPDIYRDVKAVDCAGLKKSVRETLYSLILKYKPKDMRVEQNVIVRTEPMTIKFRDNNFKVRTANMNGADIKVDFYFPDYKTAVCYDTFFYYESVCKDDVKPNTASGWSEYLKQHKNDIKLMIFIPFKSFDDRYFNLTFSAKSIIDRVISGEYSHWKYVESLH